MMDCSKTEEMPTGGGGNYARQNEKYFPALWTGRMCIIARRDSALSTSFALL